jgi:hypothetical protein
VADGGFDEAVVVKPKSGPKRDSAAVAVINFVLEATL